MCALVNGKPAVKRVFGEVPFGTSFKRAQRCLRPRTLTGAQPAGPSCGL